jgi:hypothetical protein
MSLLCTLKGQNWLSQLGDILPSPRLTQLAHPELALPHGWAARSTAFPGPAPETSQLGKVTW